MYQFMNLSIVIQDIRNSKTHFVCLCVYFVPLYTTEHHAYQYTVIMLHARFCFSYIPFDCPACANFSVSAVNPALQKKKKKNPPIHMLIAHTAPPQEMKLQQWVFRENGEIYRQAWYNKQQSAEACWSSSDLSTPAEMKPCPGT